MTIVLYWKDSWSGRDKENNANDNCLMLKRQKELQRQRKQCQWQLSKTAGMVETNKTMTMTTVLYCKDNWNGKTKKTMPMTIVWYWKDKRKAETKEIYADLGTTLIGGDNKGVLVWVASGLHVPDHHHPLHLWLRLKNCAKRKSTWWLALTWQLFVTWLWSMIAILRIFFFMAQTVMGRCLLYASAHFP